MAIVGAVRTAFLIARHPDDPLRRVLACTKNNLAVFPPALGFRIVGVPGGVARIEWLGPVERTADELVDAPSPSALIKASARVSACLLRFDPAIARWGGRGQRIDQRARDRRHVLDRPSKSRGVGLRRLVEAAQLPHELQRRRADLLVRRRGLKVE
jgi:hypothetical protein